MKSHFPRSRSVFRELQNSRAYCPLRHAAILFRKNLAHSGFFKGELKLERKKHKIYQSCNIKGNNGDYF